MKVLSIEIIEGFEVWLFFVFGVISVMIQKYVCTQATKK
jgi:hypothetical protein